MALENVAGYSDPLYTNMGPLECVISGAVQEYSCDRKIYNAYQSRADSQIDDRNGVLDPCL